MTHPNFTVEPCAARAQQNGASLIMVMIILTIVSMIGVAGLQISTMAERSARNDRDYQIAWQAAEAALADAKDDLFPGGYGAPTISLRAAAFETANVPANFTDGCGTSGQSKGLCNLVVTSDKQAWVSVDFEAAGNTAPTVEYGDFTGRTFTAGGPGVQPARKPRYVIEPMKDGEGPGSPCRNANAGASECPPVFRVTAMGFGPRADIQAVLQMIYRR